MAETINGPLHYGKTRKKILVTVEENKLFNPQTPVDGTIEVIAVSEVQLADWMRPYCDFVTPDHNQLILYQVDMMPFDYVENGIFHCVFFESIEEAWAYAKRKSSEWGIKAILGDEAQKTLRFARDARRESSIHLRTKYYTPFVKHMGELRECCVRPVRFKKSASVFMKNRYQHHRC